jgi:putative membrane protein
MTSTGVPFVPWTRWEIPTEIPVGLAALLLAYVLGLGPLRPVEARHARVRPGQVAAFVGALAVLFLALTGPLADLAGRFLFSAHMVQHLILTLAVPPLLLHGTPGWLLARILSWRLVGSPARVVTRPLIALAIFSVVLIGWHLPALYNLALASIPAHIAMHLTFLSASILGWWPLMSPVAELPALARPLKLFYIFVIGMPMLVVAALVTMTDQVLYPHYAAAPRLWGMSPLEDQRLGGIIMWVPAHVVWIVPFTIIFFRWAREEPDEDDEAPPTGDTRIRSS